jgi:hypothetical protein
MKAKGSAMARSALVSTLVPQAPSPPSQCVTSPTQAFPWPSQLAVVEPEMELLTRVAEAVVEDQVDVAAAAVVVAARARPVAGVVAVVVQN